MENPKISVVMSVYKEPEKWIRQSIDSILTQTFDDFEFLIINDCPERQENIDILSEYEHKDCRIVIITNKQNLGLTKSLNKAFNYAKGEYIARMDADDISICTRFEKQFSYLEKHSECDATFGYFYCFNENEKNPIELKKSGPTNQQVLDKLFQYNVLPHPLVMLRRRTIDSLGLKYDEEFVHSQDYDLWLMMAIRGCSFYVIPEPLLYYRISKNQITKSRSESQLNYKNKAKEKCLKQYLNDAGFGNQTEITRDFPRCLYKEIITKREWNATDKQLLMMFYVTLKINPVYYPVIFFNSILHFHFSIQQLSIILLSCFKTINYYNLKAILNKMRIAVSN